MCSYLLMTVQLLLWMTMSVGSINIRTNIFWLCLVCLEYCIPTLFIRTNDAVLYFTKLNSVWILIVYNHATITFVFIGVDVMETVECVCWHVLGLQYLPGAPIHNIQPYLWVSVFAWVIQGTPIRKNATYDNYLPFPHCHIRINLLPWAVHRVYWATVASHWCTWVAPRRQSSSLSSQS